MQALDIAVAGAGPAGLATALFLHRGGHRVTLFERFKEPAPVGSGLILQPTGLTVLGALGLLDETLALGSRIERLYGADAVSGRTILDVRYADLKRGRFGLGVHRAALFGVLYRAVLAEGIAIETGAEVGRLDNQGEKPVLAAADGRQLGRFDLVVDASGARSKLKIATGYLPEPRPLPYGAFWTTLAWRGEGFDPHTLSQRYRRSSVLVWVLPTGRAVIGGPELATLLWSLKIADAEAIKAAGIGAWKDQVRRLWPECQPYLDQIEDFGQLTLARYGHHTLKPPVGRGLAVVGDAAHSTSPILAQGANMALLDAAALAHALGSCRSLDEALVAYARARRSHIRLFQVLSRLFTPFYQSDSALLPLFRDRVVSALSRVPPNPRFLAAMVCGTLVDPFARLGLAEAEWGKIPQGLLYKAET